jgi:hypothetical protein
LTVLKLSCVENIRFETIFRKKNNSSKEILRIKRKLESLTRASPVSAEKKWFLKTKEEDWMERVICRNWMNEFCSPYRHKYVECDRKVLQERKRKRH